MNLGRRDVPMTEELFDFGDVHAHVEKERGGGGADRVRGVDATADDRAVGKLFVFHSTGQSVEIALNDPVHRPVVHGRVRKLFAPGIKPWSEERAACDTGVLLRSLRKIERKGVTELR